MRLASPAGTGGTTGGRRVGVTRSAGSGTCGHRSSWGLVGRGDVDGGLPDAGGAGSGSDAGGGRPQPAARGDEPRRRDVEALEVERAGELPARRAGHRDLQQRGRHRARGDVAEPLGARVRDDDRGADRVGEVQAAGVVGQRDRGAGDERGEHRQADRGQRPDVRGARGAHDLVDEAGLGRGAGDEHRQPGRGDRGRGGAEPGGRVAPRRARRPRHEQGERLSYAGPVDVGPRASTASASAYAASGTRSDGVRPRGGTPIASSRCSDRSTWWVVSGGGVTQCVATAPANSRECTTRVPMPGEQPEVRRGPRRLGERGEHQHDVVAAGGEPVEQLPLGPRPPRRRRRRRTAP